MLFRSRYERLAIEQEPPVIGDVDANSPAEKAGLQEGDKIVAIDGKTNPVWEDVRMQIVASPGRTVSLRVQRGGKESDVTLTPTADSVSGIGYAGWSEQVPMQVSDVFVGMPADKAGLKSGDLLISINGQPIRSHHKLQNMLQRVGGQPVTLEFLRNGEKKTAIVTRSEERRVGKECRL